MTFKKGQSGNPKGRPAIAKDIKEIARRYCPEAIEILVALMRDEAQDARARIAASKEVLDRGIGKASQQVEITTEGPALPIAFVDAPKQESMAEWLARRASDKS